MPAKSGKPTFPRIVLYLSIGYTVSLLLLFATGVLDIEEKLHSGRSIGPRLDFSATGVRILPYLAMLTGIQFVACLLIPWRWLKIVLFVLALPVVILTAGICVSEVNRPGGRFAIHKSDGSLARTQRCSCMPFCWFFPNNRHGIYEGQPHTKEYDSDKWIEENIEVVNFEYPFRRDAAYVFLLLYLLLLMGCVALYDSRNLDRILAKTINYIATTQPSQNRAQVTTGDLHRLLEQKGNVLIGRSADNDIVLVDDHISEYHAEIYLVQGSLFIRDLDSSNGTFLNNEAIKETTALKNNDKLRIGTIICTINCDDSQNSDLANRSSKETVNVKTNEAV